MVNRNTTVLIVCRRQLLLKVLKLWVVFDDNKLYQLTESKPVITETTGSPVKITVNNGYHNAGPFYITHNLSSPLFLEVGCTIDNWRLWGCVGLSIISIILFFTVDIHLFLLIANIPLLFIAYHFFFNTKKFISVFVHKQEDTNQA